MLLLAATAMEKLKTIPMGFWINVLIAIACIVGLFLFVRMIRGMNKILLVIIVGMVFALVGFNWIYERNEPAFMTPIIEKLAMFFPSKGKPLQPAKVP